MDGTPQEGTQMLYYQRSGVEDLIQRLHVMKESEAAQIALRGQKFAKEHCTFAGLCHQLSHYFTA
jgi:hypothetical protein